MCWRGEKSSRMGRDKATLPYSGTTLVNHVARLVRDAAGTVAVLGDPARYDMLGFRVYPDLVPDCGPLGGIYTALSVTSTDWNLMVACDMPSLSLSILRNLLERAAESTGECVAASGSTGEPEPLCAVYHRRCAPTLKQAIQDKRFRMRDLIKELQSETVSVASSALANVNTPADWRALHRKPE